MNVGLFLEKVRSTWSDLPNAQLNSSSNEVVDRIKTLNQLNFTLKRMATTHTGLLINLACSCLSKNEAYVNIGVWNGFTFFSGVLGNCAQAIANDSFKVYTGRIGYTGGQDRLNREFGDTEKIFKGEFNRLSDPNLHKYYVEDCWDFLARYGDRGLPKIGFYLYDGDHSYENQCKALERAYPHLSEECMIMIDDCNDGDVRRANEEFFAKNQEFTRVLQVLTPANGWPTWWNGIELYARRKK